MAALPKDDLLVCFLQDFMHYLEVYDVSHMPPEELLDLSEYVLHKGLALKLFETYEKAFWNTFWRYAFEEKTRAFASGYLQTHIVEALIRNKMHMLSRHALDATQRLIHSEYCDHRRREYIRFNTHSQDMKRLLETILGLDQKLNAEKHAIGFH
jgi:hypothetical protein